MVLGNRGMSAFISREQGNECLKMRGKCNFGGAGNIGNKDFDFGEQSNVFQGNKGTGTPWEGLIKALTCSLSKSTFSHTSNIPANNLTIRI